MNPYKCALDGMKGQVKHEKPMMPKMENPVKTIPAMVRTIEPSAKINFTQVPTSQPQPIPVKMNFVDFKRS